MPAPNAAMSYYCEYTTSVNKMLMLVQQIDVADGGNAFLHK